MANETPTKHKVQQGVAYKEIDGNITRNYVVLGGVRHYVFAEVGDELTKSQVKRMQVNPHKVEQPTEHPDETTPPHVDPSTATE